MLCKRGGVWGTVSVLITTKIGKHDVVSCPAAEEAAIMTWNFVVSRKQVLDDGILLYIMQIIIIILSQLITVK